VHLNDGGDETIERACRDAHPLPKAIRASGLRDSAVDFSGLKLAQEVIAEKTELLTAADK
jgi:hypothetical protein